MRRCIDYLNPWIVLQLTFPVICPFFVFNFFYLIFSSSAAAYVFYIILCAFTYVVFIRGAKKLRREQYRYTEKAEKLQLIQEQLNASGALNEGEKRFRKWNHDIKNHLLSLSCLMKTGNKQELNAYLEQILKTEADHEA